MKLCSIEGCGGKLRARGLCNAHYLRLPEQIEKRKARAALPENKIKARARVQKYYRTEKGAQQRRAYAQSDRGKTAHKEAKRAYRQSEKGRSAERAYKQTGEYKARCKIYESRPDVKAKHKDWRNTPFGRSYAREQSKLYARSPKGVAWQKAWQSSPRGASLLRAANGKRRAVIANAGSYTPEEWEEVLRRYGQHCPMCGEIKPLTVDHVVPVSLGGTNTADNLQPLCGTCNRSKGNRETVRYLPWGRKEAV